MNSPTRSERSQAGPRRKGRHDRHDESLDEAPELLDDEPADSERAIPLEETEENESVAEEVEDAEEAASRAFDEGPPGHDEPHE